MIIAPGDDKSEADSSSKAAVIVQRDNQIPSDDPPPSYTSHPQGQFPSPSIPPPPPPSNFVVISKSNGGVKGSWVIDPTLAVTTSFLPTLAQNETRKNFSVSAKNGAIDVDLTVVQLNVENINEGRKRRATIHFTSHNGVLLAKLHRPSHSLPLPPPSIFVTANAHNGNINLRLPRSFRGPLTITTLHGSVRFSPDVAATVTTFSDMRTKKCFLGDYSTWRDGEAWSGDEAVIDSRNGSVRIQFDDEVVSEGPRGPFFGMWSRLFGGWGG